MKTSVVRKVLVLSAVYLLAAAALAGCGTAESKGKKGTVAKKADRSTSVKEENFSESVDMQQEEKKDIDDYEEYIDRAYSGTAQENENITVFFCFKKDKSGGLLISYDSKENTFLCVGGAMEEQKLEDEKTAITIVDEISDYSFAFIAEYDKADDVYTINLGEQFGTVSVKKCKRSGVLKVFEKIEKNGAESIF